MRSINDNCSMDSDAYKDSKNLINRQRDLSQSAAANFINGGGLARHSNDGRSEKSNDNTSVIRLSNGHYRFRKNG